MREPAVDKKTKVLRLIDGLSDEKFTGRVRLTLDYKEGVILTGEHNVPL